MKSIILYTTKTQNTPRVAKAIAKGLDCKAVDVGKKKFNVKSYDLIGFGSGIYYWKHDDRIFKFVNSLDLKGKMVFIFSTEGMFGKYQHLKLRKLLKQKRAWIVGEFACRGRDIHPYLKPFKIAWNHPTEKDIENAKKFGKSLKRRVS